MAQIILDCGSGNTCENRYELAEKMIEQVAAVDTHKHEIIFKWQLFKEAGKNVPLERLLFELAYEYAEELGYKTTASVFDLRSLNFLMGFYVPFIKIACRSDLYWLIGKIPRKEEVYVSVDKKWWDELDWILTQFLCVAKYPATLADYQSDFDNSLYVENISDHTVGLELFKKYMPPRWEKHLKLPDSTGLDAGPWAVTPEELREIL